QALAGPLDPREAIAEYLKEVTACFEATGASLVLRGSDDAYEIYRLRDGNLSRRTEARDRMCVECVLAERLKPVHVQSRRAASGLPGLLASAGLREAMGAPLIQDDRRLGAVVVFNQVG